MSGVYGGSAAGAGIPSPAPIRAIKQRTKTSLSSTVETTIIPAGAPGTFNDLYGLVLANVGAVTTRVDFRDQTGGPIVATFEIPANDTRGFMLGGDSSTDQTTSGNNWTAQLTSTTQLEVTALYVANTP